MATIQTLNGTEKIKDSYGKINTSLTNLNNSKLENSGGTMTGNLSFSGNRSIQARNGDALTFFDIDFPELVTTTATLRLFRATNTTGNKDFLIHNGDGSAGVRFRITNGEIGAINGQTVKITAYGGNPNGNVAAPPGSICLNTSGGAGTSFYVKESGTGNTGWVAK